MEEKNYMNYLQLLSFVEGHGHNFCLFDVEQKRSYFIWSFSFGILIDILRYGFYEVKLINKNSVLSFVLM